MNKQQQATYSRTLQVFLTESQVKDSAAMSEILFKLHRYETILHRLAEDACERELTASEIRREENTEDQVNALAALLGFTVEFKSDPRGCAIRFILPSKIYNSWDGESWVLDW